jgi:NAD-dependent dihydropyrimidine dehydrogenase PreA subunit
MWEIVRNITEGNSKESDLDLLETLANAVKDASMCGLGQTAANPVLSTLRYFNEEYLAHIRDKKCPAGVCKDLIEYSIIAENCTGCMVCARVCPQDAITGEKQQVHVLDQEKCIKCGACFEACKFDAILVE